MNKTIKRVVLAGALLGLAPWCVMAESSAEVMENSLARLFDPNAAVLPNDGAIEVESSGDVMEDSLARLLRDAIPEKATPDTAARAATVKTERDLF